MGGDNSSEGAEIYAGGALQDTPALRAVRLLGGVLDLVDGDVGFLGTVTPEGNALDVLRVTPHSDNVVRLAFSLDAPYPLAYTARTQTPLYIANNEQLSCDHPGLVRMQSADHACVTLPLRDQKGDLLGALNVSFEDPHEFTDDERLLIDAVARRCATLLVD